MVFQAPTAKIVLSFPSTRIRKAHFAGRHQEEDNCCIMKNHSCGHALQGVQVKLETSLSSKFPLKPAKRKVTFSRVSTLSDLAD